MGHSPGFKRAAVAGLAPAAVGVLLLLFVAAPALGPRRDFAPVTLRSVPAHPVAGNATVRDGCSGSGNSSGSSTGGTPATGGLSAGGSSKALVPPPGSIPGRHQTPILHGEKYKHMWDGWAASRNATPWTETATVRWEDVRPVIGYCNWTSWHRPQFYPDDTEKLYGWPENRMQTDGALYIDAEGELFFEPADCNLYRYTAPQARSCLANKTIAVIGDSLSRYHYLSLANFLVRGQWEQRYADDPGHPTLVGHEIKAWGGWSAFLNGSTALLTRDEPGLRSFMHCNCSREDAGPVGPNTREDRDLSITLGDSTIRLIYRQCFRWPTAGEKLLQELNRLVETAEPLPDYVIVNAFAWIPWGSDVREEFSLAIDEFQPLFTAGRELMAKHPGLQLVWRTPTAAVPHLKFREVMRQTALFDDMARWSGWRVLSADVVTMPAMRQNLDVWAVDGLHPLPFMYEQLNDVMFNAMCERPGAVAL